MILIIIGICIMKIYFRIRILNWWSRIVEKCVGPCYKNSIEKKT